MNWKDLIPLLIRVPIRTMRRLWRRLTLPPLEDLPNAPDLFHMYRMLDGHPGLTRQHGGWLYKGSFYPDCLTVGGARFGISRLAHEHCIGKGIDVGAGIWPLPGAIPVDIWRGPGESKSLDDFPDGSLDYVFSSHCLEHIDRWREALRTWVGKLRQNGTIFLYLPHPDCGIWEPDSPFVGKSHCWSPTPAVIKQSLCELGCEIIEADDGPDGMWSFHVRARKLGAGSQQGTAGAVPADLPVPAEAIPHDATRNPA